MLLRSLAKLGVATLLLDPALKSTPLFCTLKDQQISADFNRYQQVQNEMSLRQMPRNPERERETDSGNTA